MDDPSIVDRDLVEDLLSDATHTDADHERVEASTLAALCRAWLALDEGVPGFVDSIWYANGAVRDTTTIKHIHGGTGAKLNVPGRVRIVKEARET